MAVESVIPTYLLLLFTLKDANHHRMQVLPISYFGNIAEVYRSVQDCRLCMVWSQVDGAVLVIIIKELSYLSVNYGSWALPARINSGSF